jgi:hypothetical protein
MYDRLARAKSFLAIAESGNSKREAYINASRELAAYREEEKCTFEALGALVDRKGNYVRTLVRWHYAGYPEDTPFLADTGATRRAERSHARKMLSDPEEALRLLSDPKVAAALAGNPDVVAALMRLASEVGDRQEKTERARFRERHPKHARNHELLTILSRLSNAHAGIVKSFGELQDMALTDEEREKVVPFVDRLNAAADMLVALLDGEAVDFDELLREEA